MKLDDSSHRIWLARRGSPRRHTVEQSVSRDERVKQNRSKMANEGQEQEVRENGVRLPQERVRVLKLPILKLGAIWQPRPTEVGDENVLDLDV